MVWHCSCQQRSVRRNQQTSQSFSKTCTYAFHTLDMGTWLHSGCLLYCHLLKVMSHEVQYKSLQTGHYTGAAWHVGSRTKGATISLSGGGLEELFSADYFFTWCLKLDFFFTHQLKPDFFFTKNWKLDYFFIVMFQVKDIHIIFRVEARLFFLQHIKAKKFFQRTGWAKLFFLAKSSARLFFQKLFQPPPR